MACCTYQLAGPAVSQHQPTFSGVHKSKELVHNHNGYEPLFLFKRANKRPKRRGKSMGLLLCTHFLGSIKSETKAM
jgi:hypothetical protein